MGEIGAWRDGSRLVVRRGAPLPPRCPFCNAPAGPEGMVRLRHTLPGGSVIAAFLPFGLGYLLKPMFEENIGIRASVCRAHQGPNPAIAIALLVLAAGAVLEIRTGWTPWAFGVLGLGIVLALLTRSPGLRVVSAQERFVRLSGADARFVASLPPWPGEKDAGVERRFN